MSAYVRVRVSAQFTEGIVDIGDEGVGWVARNCGFWQR
jgi:hypothetical protein